MGEFSPFASSPFWLHSERGIFPVVTASVNDVISYIGLFSVIIPNTRENRDRLTWGLEVQLFVEGGRRLAHGYITNVALSETAGSSTLSVTCQLLPIELKRRQIPFGREFIDTPVAVVVGWLVSLVDGWSLHVASDESLRGSVTVNLGVQSVYDALAQLASFNGFLFSFADRRVLIHDRDGDSRVVLRQSMPGAPLPEGHAVINSIVVRQHEHNVANSIRPWSGELDNHVSLMRATLNTPYMVERRKVGQRYEYWLTDQSCVQRYGLIEISESPQQLIAPLGEVESAGFNAANTLYQWACSGAGYTL